MDSNDAVILKAARIASYYHAGQYRKYGYGVPYIMHPIRVAGLVAIHPDSTSEMVAASYLHDTIEDTKYSAHQLFLDFGEKIYLMVLNLTNPSKQFPHLHRDDRKKIDREHLARCPREIKLIKMADRIDNLRDVAQADLDFIVLYSIESSRLLDEALRNVDPVYEEMYEDALKYLQNLKSWKRRKQQCAKMSLK